MRDIREKRQYKSKSKKISRRIRDRRVRRLQFQAFRNRAKKTQNDSRRQEQESPGSQATERMQTGAIESVHTASEAAYTSGRRLFVQKRRQEKQTVSHSNGAKKNASQIETHFDIRQRRAGTIKEHKTVNSIKQKNVQPVTKAAHRPHKPPSAVQRGQQKAVRDTASNAAQPVAKKVTEIVSRAGKAIVSAVSKGFSAILAMGSAGILIVAILFLGAIAGVVASPFGLFFAGERTEPDTYSVAEAVGAVQADFNARLASLQNGVYDSIQITGSPPPWTEVLAVFSAKTTAAEDGTDVATLTAEKVEILKTVFWDMTEISSEIETINAEGSGAERVLCITITHKTADEMRTIYSFTDAQNTALTELLEHQASLSELTGDLSITNADAQTLLKRLPADLSPQRRAVVTTACQLLGKINYFWGGKSLTLGWDARWGQLMQVTAAGSHITGTWRPFGMDCSGFVDWVFYNASNGAVILGQGGGTQSQHARCTPISAAEAQPGDVVFYADDSHVGIVGGRDENENLLIIHCASGYDTVVITGQGNFSAFTRPSFSF